jgi:hypothetical protein
MSELNISNHHLEPIDPTITVLNCSNNPIVVLP